MYGPHLGCTYDYYNLPLTEKRYTIPDWNSESVDIEPIKAQTIYNSLFTAGFSANSFSISVLSESGAEVDM